MKVLKVTVFAVTSVIAVIVLLALSQWSSNVLQNLFPEMGKDYFNGFMEAVRLYFNVKLGYLLMGLLFRWL